MQDLFRTSIEMEKLERLEFNGTRGRGLAAKVREVYEGFERVWKLFRDAEYDSFDLSDDYGDEGRRFLDDYRSFQRKIDEIDQTVANLLTLSFNDCTGLEGMFKVGARSSSFLAFVVIDMLIDDVGLAAA